MARILNVEGLIGVDEGGRILGFECLLDLRDHSGRVRGSWPVRPNLPGPPKRGQGRNRSISGAQLRACRRPLCSQSGEAMTEEALELTAGYDLHPSDPKRLGSITLVRRLCSHRKTIENADKPVPFLGHSPPRTSGGPRVDLVVKIAPANGDKHIQRFMREEEIWATAVGLKHATGKSGYLRWFARRYIKGKSLDLAAKASPGDVSVYAKRTLEAIRDLHVTGEAHFDVKPTNVIITADRAVLIDFEASSGADGLAPVPLVTERYASPEQLRGPHSQVPGTAADVFSWGLSIVELYQSGFHPYCGGAFSLRRMREIQSSVDTGAPPPEPRLEMITDLRLRHMVSEALTWQADARPSAAQLLNSWVFADETKPLYQVSDDSPSGPKETLGDSIRELVAHLSWQGSLGDRRLSPIEYSLLGAGGLALGILLGVLILAVIP